MCLQRPHAQLGRSFLFRCRRESERAVCDIHGSRHRMHGPAWPEEHMLQGSDMGPVDAMEAKPCSMPLKYETVVRRLAWLGAPKVLCWQEVVWPA